MDDNYFFLNGSVDDVRKNMGSLGKCDTHNRGSKVWHLLHTMICECPPPPLCGVCLYLAVCREKAGF